jgi:hypothetical protein
MDCMEEAYGAFALGPLIHPPLPKSLTSFELVLVLFQSRSSHLNAALENIEGIECRKPIILELLKPAKSTASQCWRHY